MQVSSATTNQNVVQTPARPKAGISSDFETFLKMLTAQMNNQDPLNPMDSTDFAVQLATFSGVEQQVRTNELLTALTGQSMAQFAGWVGMEVRSTAPASFGGQPITVFPEPDILADAAQLVVRDDQGTEIQRLDISLSSDPYSWSGIDGGGIPVADGSYSFTLDSFSGGKLIATTPVQSYATVAEARTTGGQVVLVLDSGAEVAVDAVTAVRSGQG